MRGKKDLISEIPIQTASRKECIYFSAAPKPQILASLFCHVVPVTALRPHWNQTTDDMLSLRLIFVQTDYNLIIRTTVLKKDSEIFQVRLNCGNQNGHTG